MSEQAADAAAPDVEGISSLEHGAIERALAVVDRLVGPPQCFFYARSELKTLRLKAEAFDAIGRSTPGITGSHISDQATIVDSPEVHS